MEHATEIAPDDTAAAETAALPGTLQHEGREDGQEDSERDGRKRKKPQRSESSRDGDSRDGDSRGGNSLAQGARIEYPWRLRQRWTKVLFAHWPMRPAAIQARLPRGLAVDTFDGWAWLAVVPFFMDQVRLRTLGQHSVSIPGATAFPELNLRTYVRAPDGRPGVYFFSLDAGSLLGVLGARIGFGLPYFWARMQAGTENGVTTYRSRRLLGGDVRYLARYRSLGTLSPEDDLRHFLTERYALFTRRFGSVQRGDIHHGPWLLENAEAEIVHDDLPASFGFTLPTRPPILHFGPEVHMQAWMPRRVSATA